MRVAFLFNDADEVVAVTPSLVSKYANAGIDVVVPKQCGKYFSAQEYATAGAKIEDNSIADIYVGIKPDFEKLHLNKDAILVVSLQRENKDDELNKLKQNGVTCCVLEKIPRITRAQSMDILSSQANIAGYRAVLEALQYYKRVVPLMMTAAGTIRPAKVLIIGAGVAGLQAIATAKRLGASVFAFDVRAAAKEQVESLGATFIEVENADTGETAGGYAKEMSDDYKKRQAEKLKEATSKSDIIITTAQIPGKQAPKLITKDMVDKMPHGSVIVDMAASSGGNCELTKKDEVVIYKNTTIVGNCNIAEKVADDASQLMACNIYNFIKLFVRYNKIDLSDEIIQTTIF